MVQVKNKAARKAPQAPAAVPTEPESEAAHAALPVEIEIVPELKAEDEGKAKKKARKDKDKGKNKKKRKKEAVVLRFETAQLALIDAQANNLGLSRAAWVRMVVAQALAAI